MFEILEGIITELAIAGSTSAIATLVLLRKKLPVSRKRFDVVTTELEDTRKAADALEKQNREIMTRYLDATSDLNSVQGVKK